ncbi:hypothetical protein [Lysobacter silvisoli]|uniref:Uncharacterized protein n=1 Tax=Lysobacter silvisoli TaxID=2293254 RepID=A0A371JXN8_9GAMM|nr:hypothetical protein [Lysobacter silvisoli]RDZ26425.1 hypothetical protein DX914_15600 [Lysobacter silvisoli]
MRQRIIVVLAWLLVSVSGLSHAETFECSFDQANQIKRIAEAAARRPGGRIGEQGHAVSWRNADGSVLSLSHGGCADLGTTIRLNYPPGKRPEVRIALRRLFAAVSERWSKADADNMVAAFAQHQFETRSESPKLTELDLQRGDGSAFPLGLTLSITPAGVAVTWTEG